MKTNNIEDIFTLSPIQQGMLFHMLADAESRMYYEQEVCRLTGEMDLSAFRFAWEELVRRHQMLRTFFAWNDLPHPVQIVRAEIELPFVYTDLRELDKELQQSEIQNFLQKDAKESAKKIDDTPLFNLRLFQTGEAEYVFVLSIHHLIHDAWSFTILLDELIEIYTAKLENRPPQLTTPKTYKDYIVWLKRQNLEAGLEFWRNSLKDFSETAKNSVKNEKTFTARKKNLEIETSDVFGKTELNLSEKTSAKIFAKARNSGITPNIVFQSLWAIASVCLTAGEKIIFGVTVAGRPIALGGVETIVGDFINTLPLGVSLLRAGKLSDLWTKLQQQQANASLYEYIPLARITAVCSRKTGEDMFESILVYQNFFRQLNNKSAANLYFRSSRTFGHPNYPLTVRVTPKEEIFIELIYDERIHAPESIAEIAEILSGLCEFIADKDDLSVGEVLNQANTVLREKRKAETLNKRSLFAKKLSSVKAVSTNAEKS